MMDFNSLRQEFPSASPQELYDIAAERLQTASRWETASWATLQGWMDMFANAPTSLVIH